MKFLFFIYKLYQFNFIGHFVEIHTSTLIFMPYLVNNSNMKTDVEKWEKCFFSLESVDQENKQDGKIDIW